MNLKQLHAIADTCPYDFGAGVRLLSDEDTHGFLGQGADLTAPTLLHAYRCGVFPWFNEDEPTAWWSPDPRCVLVPSDFVPKKSLTRTACKAEWTLTTNHAFTEVIKACAKPRAYADGTWIGDDMIEAYTRLHELGVAVSVEVWQGEPLQSPLIGGLYGLNIGAVFCGESMFHRVTDSSKVAFWGLMTLCQKQGITLVDCQLENSHLMSLGAKLMDRAKFLSRLNELVLTEVNGLNEQKFRLAVCELAVSH